MRKDIGIIAVGQAGGNIAHLLEQKGFEALYINSSSGDLGTINTNKQNKYHISNGIGCAKDRLASKKLMKDDINSIIEFIKSRFENKKVIFVTFSTGGGTGSGASIILASMLIKILNKKVGLITILPSKKDTLQAHLNCYECFSEIAKLENLGATFVIDNNKNSNKKMINERFVKLFDNIFEFEKYESEKGNIDISEMLKLLTTKGMSIISEVEKEVGLLKLFQKIKENDIFAPLQNDGKVAYLGLSTKQKFNKEDFIKEIGKYIDKFQNYNKDYSFLIISGLSFPINRIIEIKQKVIEEQEVFGNISKNINYEEEFVPIKFDFLGDAENKEEEKDITFEDIFNDFL